MGEAQSGVIDEDNDLGSLADKLGQGTAVIDVSEIERINSCGVRDWVNWLGKAEKNGASFVLVECSPAIVAQINLVNNFTGQGVVKSFYAPYFCPNCDIEKALLVETTDVTGRAAVPSAGVPLRRVRRADGLRRYGRFVLRVPREHEEDRHRRALQHAHAGQQRERRVAEDSVARSGRVEPGWQR